MKRKVVIFNTFGDERMFLKNFKQGLSDCFAQDWHHDITASHKLNYYASFKYTLEI